MFALFFLQNVDRIVAQLLRIMEKLERYSAQQLVEMQKLEDRITKTRSEHERAARIASKVQELLK